MGLLVSDILNVKRKICFCATFRKKNTKQPFCFHPRVPLRVWLTGAPMCVSAPPVCPWPIPSRRRSWLLSGTGVLAVTPCVAWPWPPVTPHWGWRRWTLRTQPNLLIMRWGTLTELKQGGVPLWQHVKTWIDSFTSPLRLTWPSLAVWVCWIPLVRRSLAPLSCAGLLESVSSWSLVSIVESSRKASLWYHFCLYKTILFALLIQNSTKSFYSPRSVIFLPAFHPFFQVTTRELLSLSAVALASSARKRMCPVGPTPDVSLTISPSKNSLRLCAGLVALPVWSLPTSPRLLSSSRVTMTLLPWWEPSSAGHNLNLIPTQCRWLVCLYVYCM